MAKNSMGADCQHLKKEQQQSFSILANSRSRESSSWHSGAVASDHKPQQKRQQRFLAAVLNFSSNFEPTSNQQQRTLILSLTLNASQDHRLGRKKQSQIGWQKRFVHRLNCDHDDFRVVSAWVICQSTVEPVFGATEFYITWSSKSVTQDKTALIQPWLSISWSKPYFWIDFERTMDLIKPVPPHSEEPLKNLKGSLNIFGKEQPLDPRDLRNYLLA